MKNLTNPARINAAKQIAERATDVVEISKHLERLEAALQQPAVQRSAYDQERINSDIAKYTEALAKADTALLTAMGVYEAIPTE